MDKIPPNSRIGKAELDEEAIETDHYLLSIGARIRKLRVEKKYSQEGFALHIGLARSYYGAVERGERNFSVTLLLRIARGLQVEAGVLLPPLSDFSSLDIEAENGQVRQLSEPRFEQEPVVRDMQASRQVDFVGAGVAAKILGVSRRTILRWVADGILAPQLVENNNGNFVAIFNRESLLRLSATAAASMVE